MPLSNKGIKDSERDKFTRDLDQVKVDLNSSPRMQFDYNGDGEVSIIRYYNRDDVLVKRTTLTYDAIFTTRIIEVVNEEYDQLNP